MKRFATVAVIVVFAVSALLFWGLRIENHVVECGFRSPVLIQFNQPDGHSLQRGWFGTYQFRIDRTGTLKIRDAPPPDGWSWLRLSEQCEGQRRASRLRADRVHVGGRVLAVRKEGHQGQEHQVADSTKDPTEGWMSYVVVEDRQ